MEACVQNNFFVLWLAAARQQQWWPPGSPPCLPQASHQGPGGAGSKSRWAPVRATRHGGQSHD